MTAYVLVRPDPYMAVSDKKGEFEIADIPAGMHTFRIWHEALGYLKIVTLNGVKSENNRGYHKINVAAGQNALNEITIDAADYTKQLKKIK
jgi:hypothetical protein